MSGDAMRIKVCGVTRIEDGLAAARLGVDMLGLNFWPKSRRWIEPDRARELAAGLPADIETVGVFVDASADDIASIARHVGLDWVQLHGDEPPEAVAQLTEWRLIRAFRVRDEASLEAAAAYTARCRQLGRAPDAFLFDAYDPSLPGGTGRAFQWEWVCRPDRPEPLMLAGGLRPETVAEAVQTVRPWAVDVAGGVERAPGVKDVDQMAAFVRAARSRCF